MNRIRLKDGIIVNDDGYAIDSGTGMCYSLTGSALDIMHCLKSGQMNIREISVKITDSYDIDLQTATIDVEDFIGELSCLGLLV